MNEGRNQRKRKDKDNEEDKEKKTSRKGSKEENSTLLRKEDKLE